jgi:hypothetical protein
MNSEDATYADFCPRCQANSARESVKRKSEALAAYGKVGPGEFLRVLDSASNALSIPMSFWEKYSIGIDESGIFTVTYHGICRKCDLEHGFSHAQQVFDLEKGKE